MPRPFEVDPTYLRAHLDELVAVTFSDLESEFLLMPEGPGFIGYGDFQDAYHALKRHTSSFSTFTVETVGRAIREDSRAFGVVRAILGMTAPEWAELARREVDVGVGQGTARSLDRACRGNAAYVRELEDRYSRRVDQRTRGGAAPPPRPKALDDIDALVSAAVRVIGRGAPPIQPGVLHRLAKFDTAAGLASLQYAATEDVLYPVVLYERYLGRPFAGHRDAVAGLVGDVMESAIAEQLRSAGIAYRKTGRAERIPGFGQAPDFCVPDEVYPMVVIEAKIASDDGTARDKVTRIVNLVTQRDRHVAEGAFAHYEVVACVDGRGFRVRREDMRQLLLRLDGKVFTSKTLRELIPNTRLRRYVSKEPAEA